MVEFTVRKNGKLVKSVLENVEGVSFSAVMKALRKKDVKVNGKRTSDDLQVFAGDNVCIYVKEINEPEFKVLFENDDILVIDKPSGYTSETVFANLSRKGELYFIHRLDRNTSGVMIFAKNKIAETELVNGFKTHEFIKIYLAQVFGKMEKSSEVLTAYLVKDSKTSTVKIYRDKLKGSVPIKTGYETVLYKDGVSTLKVRLYTGKTHQIRAHLAFIGHPIVGDGKYGDGEKNKLLNEKTQRLTAYSLTLSFCKDSPLYYLSGKTFVSEMG